MVASDRGGLAFRVERSYQAYWGTEDETLENYEKFLRQHESTNHKEKKQ